MVERWVPIVGTAAEQSEVLCNSVLTRRFWRVRRLHTHVGSDVHTTIIVGCVCGGGG